MDPLASSTLICAVGLTLVTALAAHDLRASHEPEEHSIRGVGILVGSVALIAAAIAVLLVSLAL